MARRRRPKQSEVARVRRERIDRYRSEPAQWAVALRPLGYLVLTAVWTTLLLISWFLPLILPLELTDGRDVSISGVLEASDPVTVIVYVAVIALVAAPVLGYVFLALPIASGSLAVLSLTYVVRSLRPSYRHERLSATGWSYGTIGLSVLPTGLSLIPIRMTRWSAFWAGAYALGWFPSFGTLLAGWAAGLGYFATIAWTLWPPEGPIALASGCALSAAFLAAVIVLLVREARRRYFRAGSA